MKRLTVAFAALCLSSTMSLAAVEFQGSLCITSITPICPSWGWTVGTCVGVRFGPPNLGGNGPSTGFSVFSHNFAAGYVLPVGSLVGTTFRSVQGYKVHRGAYTFNGTKMRFTSQVPAVPTIATTSITQVGGFQKWDDLTGCTITFRTSLTRKP